jgi:hypothetical protein
VQAPVKQKVDQNKDDNVKMRRQNKTYAAKAVLQVFVQTLLWQIQWGREPGRVCKISYQGLR